MIILEPISLRFGIVKIMTKTAIITGSAKNMGKDIVRECMELGYKYGLLDDDG